MTGPARAHALLAVPRTGGENRCRVGRRWATVNEGSPGWTRRGGAVVLDAPAPQVDYRATSRRPQWSELPPALRTVIEDAAGSRVASAAPSVSSGFTGGFASRRH